MNMIILDHWWHLSMKSPSSPSSPSKSIATFNSVYDQWNQQLNAEILDEEAAGENTNSTQSNNDGTMTKRTDDVNNVGKTKMSVSVIGDAFVDLFCYLNDGSSDDGGKLPGLGADVRVNQPVKPVAGGSGINTATHLASLIEQFPYRNNNTEEGDIEEPIDVTVQTVVNENDNYGRLLINHAKRSKFEIINCRRENKVQSKKNDSDDNSGENNNSQESPISNNGTTTNTNNADDGNVDVNSNDSVPSTGHCIVFVTENERSFITHLGIMGTFQPCHTIMHELVNCRSANPVFLNHHHHIHLAGYYNLPKFQSKNALRKRVKLIREKRRTQSHGRHVFTTTVSLTPQYDATEEWNTVELFDLLPLVDFLILNLTEACKISKIPLTEESEENGGSALNRSVLFLRLADFFDVQSPQTYVVVTLGKLGSVLLYRGEIAHMNIAPMKYDDPVDPTGAGDAFVSGFLFGVMNWRRQRQHNEVHEIGSVLEEAGGWTDAIEVGMRWGCVAGTGCVMKAGASVSSSKDELVALLHPVDISDDEDREEEDDDREEEDDDSKDVEGQNDEYELEDEDDDSEFDDDYMPHDESSSFYSSSYSDVDEDDYYDYEEED